jgi:hypothetical protein
MDNSSPVPGNQDSGKRLLDRQLEGISWALFLIMIGGLWLIPNVPGGLWLIGVGLIMLGLNVARYLKGIRVHAFSSVLGALALLLGVAELLGLGLPVLPILLIVIGASIIFDVIVSSATRPSTLR